MSKVSEALRDYQTFENALCEQKAAELQAAGVQIDASQVRWAAQEVNNALRRYVEEKSLDAQYKYEERYREAALADSHSSDVEPMVEIPESRS